MDTLQLTADLHCHSTFSDGFLTPKQLVDMAIEKGLKGLSITDHDTIGAYLEFIEEAKKSSLRIISGVEFSSALNDFPIHILGYSFQLDHPKILAMVEFHTERRTLRNQQILKNLASFDIHLSMEEIKEILPHMNHQIGRAHIAYCLYKKGLIESPQEAFKKWIGDSKPCFATSAHPTIAETIETIHAAKGFAIIAHPHLIKKKTILRSLLKFAFDGIEARYALFNPLVNLRFLDIAKSRDWIVTGGSDFHGEIRPHNPLGAATTEEDIFTLFEERYLVNNFRGV